MTVKELFSSIEKLYFDALEMDKDAQEILAANSLKALELNEREKQVAEIESASVALKAARKLTLALEQKGVDVDNARADFENWKRIELQKIADATAALQVLKDQEAQLRKDKEAFQVLVLDLEKEKSEYRKRIKAELVAHFKNTKGNEV